MQYIIISNPLSSLRPLSIVFYFLFFVFYCNLKLKIYIHVCVFIYIYRATLHKNNKIIFLIIKGSGHQFVNINYEILKEIQTDNLQ